jgi:CRISPR/Cas system CSM-associated protein Csm3 (group 7 of RAMP superfamily)
LDNLLKSDKLLKGEGFTNRYRITGKLKTLSPLHIGTGVEDDNFPFSDSEKKKYTEKMGKVPSVSTIMRDHRGKPLLPGSSLRGVIRHWLLHILGGFNAEWADTRDYQKDWEDLDQDAVITKIQAEFSWLELLFGTPLHAGKLEVWDATCLTPSLSISDPLLNWNEDRLTYVDTSVAIDPTRGTALNKLLYKTEIVPPGVEFDLNLAGQNLSDIELGMVLLALQGFNSEIYPIRIGARGGRGYGRVQFIPGPIYRLDKENLGQWLTDTLNQYGSGDKGANAGYYNLPKLSAENQANLIQRVKAQMKTTPDGNHVQ